MTRTSAPAALIAVAVITTALAACGDGPVASTTTSSTSPTVTTITTSVTTATPPLIPLQGPPSDYDGYRAQDAACGAEAPPPAQRLQFSGYDDAEVPAGTTATLVTSCGEIVIALDPVTSPETVKSFVFLARQGYFDGTVFHRIVPGFVIQAGDPTGTGRGNPGYVVPDELPDDGFAYDYGVVAMANGGPQSTGSQFFIMVGEAGLPPRYSPLGEMVSGEETILEIVRVPLAASRAGERSVPLETVYIESVAITTP